MRSFVVAGTATGVGKTSVSVGLMRSLSRRGQVVQPFKIGPDFIDPVFHRAATGRWSRNLDGWMLTRESNAEVFQRATVDADVAIVEGMMGLYDGIDGTSETASTAQIAKWLGLPVILMVDASSLSRSAGAVVKGFSSFDPDVRIAGVILNQVGSQTHAAWLTEAIEGSTGIRVLGSLPFREGLARPERHLGLRALEDANPWLEGLAELIEGSIHIEGVLDAAIESEAAPARPEVTPEHQVRIGVARDEAFWFIYPDNLELLQRAGAKLVFFSPMRDPLPEDLDGLYLPGGYPELHLRELSSNRASIEAIRTLCDSGAPVYAECGGLMYLGEIVEDEHGDRYELCGVLPCSTRLGRAPTIGYVEVETKTDAVFPKGAVARGHSFHYSQVELRSEVEPAYLATSATGGSTDDGMRIGNVLASYVHLHFGSDSSLASAFVESCRRDRAALPR